MEADLKRGKKARFSSTSIEDAVVDVTHVYNILDLIGKSRDASSPCEFLSWNE
jgi:hypothetical protein